MTALAPLRCRLWEGAVADLWDVRCGREFQADYVSPNPRLFILLESEGEGVLRLDVAGEGAVLGASSISFVPAGLPARASVTSPVRLRHLDLHFDEELLTRRFRGSLDREHLRVARLAVGGDALVGLARLLAAECESAAPHHDLYASGLVDALQAAFFQVPLRTPRRRGVLSKARLRRVVDYIEEHSLEPVRLGRLASLAGLSESAFSHAFKAATGVSPLRWHMQVRIRKVQELLALPGRSVTEVAAACGFSDQAHLARAFKAMVGTTPTQWRRQHGV